MAFSLKMMEPLFKMLERTYGVIAGEEHHPEGDVFNHSLQTLKWAFRETTDTNLILAAMLHDVGKYEMTTGHDIIGADMIRDYVSEKTRWLVQNHMRFWYFAEGRMRKYSKVMELGYSEWFTDLVWLVRWDKMGRHPTATPKYDKEKIVEKLNKCLEEIK